MKTLSAEIAQQFYERLRRRESPSTVPGSLPVLFFGDLLTAKIVTVGLNPSRREYTDKHNEELDGPVRRFETLASLGAADRAGLTASQCDAAISTMRAYFDPGKPAYSWFASLARVVEGMGYQYRVREVAHLDLVQEATDPTWSALCGQNPEEARTLLNADASFLRWQIEAFPLYVLVCNGRTTFDNVVHLTQARIVERDRIGRLTWWIAQGTSGQRDVAVVGWNIPLARPTGLSAPAHVAFGEQIHRRLNDLGIVMP